tara:strand:- start:26 stop:217 length:192 start_codon:yes stop_codon:yes gene_type:complete
LIKRIKFPGIAAPVYLGWVFDTTGSYLVALRVIIALLIGSGIYMFLARHPKPPVGDSDIRNII